MFGKSSNYAGNAILAICVLFDLPVSLVCPKSYGSSSKPARHMCFNHMQQRRKLQRSIGQSLLDAATDGQIDL